MDAYLRYGPALVRKARRVLQNRDDAQDVVQALFLDLLQRADRPETQEPLQLGYLYRAVTNRCLNLIRDRSQRARLLAQHDPSLCAPMRTTCEDRVIDLDLLLKLSQQLDEATCELLVYRFIDDLPQEEIAQLTGWSRKTIGKRLADIQAAVVQIAQTGGTP